MKYGITTILKNEHDYINEFIGYHVQIGFTFFYILVDNICYEQDSYVNYIHPEYIKYVQFFYVDKSFNENICATLINNGSNTHQYWINYFNTCVLPIIKTEVDWVAVIGCDSFLKLEHNNIHNFIIDNNITNDITQIAFPWMPVFNFDGNNYDLLTPNLNKMYYFPQCDHTYTMGNTSKIKNLIGSSHCFSSCDATQKIFICDDIIKVYPENVNIYDIFKYSSFKKTLKNFAIHIKLRNYDEMIIKDFFSWKNMDLVNEDFKNLIINNETNNFTKNKQTNRLQMTAYADHALKVPFFIDNKILHYKNKKNMYAHLILLLLHKNNITRAQYDKFIYLKKIKQLPNDFDWEEYISLHKDLKHMNKSSAETHYLKNGANEYRQYKYSNIPSDFNWEIYVSVNEDISYMNKIEAISHYSMHGYKEKRKYKYENIPEDFNCDTYITLNDDLKNMTNIQAKNHYEYFGYKEKRKYLY